jgi:meso-butanediol dehydrogenase/(S,S)-butanediol dehydrogenase/diacetyl reductase
MRRRFTGKVALVTGAASGIGAATARRLRSEGARVALADLNEPAGTALAKELAGDDDGASFHSVDVAELASVERLVAEVVGRFGRLDVLVNNAGIGSFGETPDVDPEQWHRVIAVDLHSVFYGCRTAIPELSRAGGGAIVNTASISGLGGDYGFAAYNAAKGAVVNYTRTLALDHAKDGIRTNAVCPGPRPRGGRRPHRPHRPAQLRGAHQAADGRRLSAVGAGGLGRRGRRLRFRAERACPARERSGA